MRYYELLEDVTDTPAFKSWFANSKVVKGGKPLMMFHGTNKAFQTFHLGSHFGSARAANHRLGFLRGEHKRNGWADELENQHVIPVYLSIQNPLRVTDMDSGDEATLLNSIARGKYPALDVHIGRREGAYVAAERAGYDGLVYRNNIEDRGKYSWVVFHPEQVRSALVETQSKIYETGGMRLLKNPSVLLLLGMLKRSTYKSLRGLVVRDNLWWWDADGALHSDLAQNLNHKDYLVDRLHLDVKEGEARIGYFDDGWTFEKIMAHPMFAKLARSPDIYFYEHGHGWITGPQFVAANRSSID
jgi:hypothetical protein